MTTKMRARREETLYHGSFVLATSCSTRSNTPSTLFSVCSFICLCDMEFLLVVTHILKDTCNTFLCTTMFLCAFAIDTDMSSQKIRGETSFIGGERLATA